jgi:hypothetical protein
MFAYRRNSQFLCIGTVWDEGVVLDSGHISSNPVNAVMECCQEHCEKNNSEFSHYQKALMSVKTPVGIAINLITMKSGNSVGKMTGCREATLGSIQPLGTLTYGKIGRSIKLISRLHLVPRSRIRGHYT